MCPYYMLNIWAGHNILYFMNNVVSFHRMNEGPSAMQRLMFTMNLAILAHTGQWSNTN